MATGCLFCRRSREAREKVFITQKPIDANIFIAEKPDASCGAVATFFGVVRNHHEGRSVEKLYYECYAEMANQEIQRIVQQVRYSEDVEDIQIMHRVGWLEIGEIAIAVKAASAHRREAFAACRRVVDEVKAKVPIWKKEFYTDGTSQWILCSHGSAQIRV